jgi:Xaa-Pro aminopeptidase
VTTATAVTGSTDYAARLDRVRAAMAGAGVDTLLLSVGGDLPWLIGYQAMDLPRLTMLVVPRDGHATLVIPNLEVPRVVPRGDAFTVRGWAETEDPVGIVVDLAGRTGQVAVGDQTWGRYVIELVDRLPGAPRFRRATDVIGPLRQAKEPGEIEALRAAAAAADRVAAQLQGGEVPLVGRTEAEVSADLSRRLLAEGHSHVNFAIVAAGENASSPHHEAGPRVIRAGEVVLCDFGGVYPPSEHEPGYCSDITRCVWTGEPDPAFAELYAVLFEAQAAGVDAASVGTPAEDVDRTTRKIIGDAGYGGYFIHRTGHGIGLFEHEDPYIVEGNRAPLAAGNAFSIEPGIYVPGRWGARLEDIVVATEAGPEPLNRVEHALVSVEA